MATDRSALSSLGAVNFVQRAARVCLRGVNSFRRDRQIGAHNRQKLAALRAAGREIWIELGSGPRPGTDGWTTVDLPGADLAQGADLFLDLNMPLPFADNEVSRIYCSHVLEHFYIQSLVKLVAECHRILRPGGVMSVAVPNARLFLDGYRNPESLDKELFLQYTPAVTDFGRMDIINYIAYMNADHRYMFDEENLIGVLRSAGFSRVALRDFDPTLDKKERHHESIYALAVK